jgi:transposase
MSAPILTREDQMERYFLGLDWADEVHAIWVINEKADKVWEGKVKQTPDDLAGLGRRLYEWQSNGIEVWAALEKPEGRIVDFLLDHTVTVYPINPKAVDRARDRFRASSSKSDSFDARVIADFLRTDSGRLHPLLPNSPASQELKLLTSDYQRFVRQQTRLINQLTITLKEFNPRILEMFSDLNTPSALDFLADYPTPSDLANLTAPALRRFAREHRLHKETETRLWELSKAPQLVIPAHVVRAKERFVQALIAELRVVRQAVADYQAEIERFFASMPAAKVAKSLPAGKSGVTVPTIWAEIGDVLGRWESFRHLQAQAGAVPVTVSSGKHRESNFRFACNKRLRHALVHYSFVSLHQSEWALAYYRAQIARGHRHYEALRALSAKWLKIIFVMWSRNVPYSEEYHLASINRQTNPQYLTTP